MAETVSSEAARCSCDAVSRVARRLWSRARETAEDSRMLLATAPQRQRLEQRQSLCHTKRLASEEEGVGVKVMPNGGFHRIAGRSGRQAEAVAETTATS